MTDWWPELVSRWWPDDKGIAPTKEVRRWLQSKHDVAAKLRPLVIGEIGVRAGYSAFAMLSASPIATYIGIDVGDSEEYGTEPGALAHGRAMLASFCSFIIVVDSHDISLLPPMDLLHIDGDHSLEGCAADLELAERSGVRHVLVDDYHTGPIVCAAVDAFVQSRGLRMQDIDDGFRGSALIYMDPEPDWDRE